ncbi:TPA_asm: UL50.6 sORF [Human alphaherpesvirus 1]|uniref:Uncharacterized protein n=1 Tax=Human herpesvirus 1 TaxID=10298 RepID=A0A2Z4H003_HHV1|nr:hypothetical protein [Human alphaherpesvirus 1]AWW09519.1 hypothetical protein [Human alphaherpesvirus 1]DAC85389.1 TPA_asm: UL50.6 sORF [Human alphaherpesvirus 1]
MRRDGCTTVVPFAGTVTGRRTTMSKPASSSRFGRKAMASRTPSPCSV